MADPNQWGPLVWKILHIQAEHLGKQTIPMLKKDESLLIHKFLKQIYFILPCSICKNHYNEYYLTHSSKEIQYDSMHTFLVNYFYDLHNRVNEKNSKNIYKTEELEIYKSYTKGQYNSLLKEFEQLFKKVYAIRYYISIDAVNDFLITIFKLRKLTYF